MGAVQPRNPNRVCSMQGWVGGGCTVACVLCSSGCLGTFGRGGLNAQSMTHVCVSWILRFISDINVCNHILPCFYHSESSGNVSCNFSIFVTNSNKMT